MGRAVSKIYNCFREENPEGSLSVIAQHDAKM
jgi:hypothetical protein